MGGLPALAAVGLFRGERHVITYENEELEERLGNAIGKPVSEVYCEDRERALEALMTQVLRTGRPVRREFPAGVLEIVPRRDGVWGVATRFVAAPVPALPPDEPTLRPRELVPLD